jgi:membrane protease YdiL (CAAX protease family)
MTDPDTRGWRTSLRRHDALVFYVLTLALTWVVWVPRAMGMPVGVVGQLWTWIPAIAALCGADGWPGGGTRSWPAIGAVAGSVVVVSGCLGRAPGVLADSCRDCGAAGRAVDPVQPAALRLSIPALALTFLILMISDGLGEELGWRGYLLPRLLSRYRAIPASLILGFGWWLWHLPLIWTAGAAMEAQPLWLLLADLMAKSLIFTYVFLGTQGSVLFAIMLHASTNLFAVSPTVASDSDLTLPLVALTLKWVLAIALLVRLPRSFGDGRGSGPAAAFQRSATSG